MWRLITAAILLLLSLLVLFKAPTNFLWKAAIGLTEFPYIPIFVSIAFFTYCLWAMEYKVPLVVLNIASVIIFCLPVIKACQRSSGLNEALSKVFPYRPHPQYLQQPYSFIKMFSGIGATKVPFQSLFYKKRLLLDFYPAASLSQAPCVVVVHGGSWAGGDSRQLPELNSYLASPGYHVAAINYGLAPQCKSPSQVNDTRDAIHYLTREAGRLNIDTGNFVLLGRSAGGQIALVAAYSLNDPRIRGVVSVYSPADMVWGARIKGNPLVLNTDKVFKDYLGGTIDQVPEKYTEASACEYVTQHSTPTLIIHGANDAMVSYEHSVRLDQKLTAHQVKHYFLDLPWATHGCDYNINGPSGQISTFAIERFINSVTN